MIPTAAEIVGVIAASSKRLPEPDFDPETLLLRTACATLRFTPADVVEAMIVSLPVGGGSRLARLRTLGREVAGEYGFGAELDLVNTNLRVRITRPDAPARGTRR